MGVSEIQLSAVNTKTTSKRHKPLEQHIKRAFAAAIYPQFNLLSAREEFNLRLKDSQ
jgi:hypothetical protein